LSLVERFCQNIYRRGIQRFIIFVIIFNAVILGFETSPKIIEKAGWLFSFLELVCLTIFCVELTMKIICERLSFFKSGWNIFDFLIVGISLVPNSGQLSILRSLRILRLNRLIVKLPRLRVIVEAILRSLPSIGWIAFLLSIIFYIFSVLTTTLFGPSYPEWFGNIGASMYTLFQMLTLESWSMGIARPVMSTFPNAYLVFVPFILITSFIVLNMFIGVIVNTIGEVMTEQRSDGPGTDAAGNETNQGGQTPESPADGKKPGPYDAALRTQPDHLAVLGGEILSLRAQLDRIENLLKVRKD
ncbi:MAG: ion transporter, partial [Deltaproteobacteria bacterium]|nr:ion transporter [Deltaproteobacteria bacterium]